MGLLWTTMDAVKMERMILVLCAQNQGKFKPIASDQLIEQYCESAKLNPEQTVAVQAILQSKDQVLAVQGHAGTGKTTMLRTVLDILRIHNHLTNQKTELLGLAPTHTAVKELNERGLPAQTLDRFLLDHAHYLELSATDCSKQIVFLKKNNLILVMDESSMVSNRKMLSALQIANQIGCRVIVTGDQRQIPSIESGKPFDLIQSSPAVQTITLKMIQRQKNLDLKQAVKETIVRDFKAAFEVLKNVMIEVPTAPNQQTGSEQPNPTVREANRLVRLQTLVKDYLNYPPNQREQIQVITPGHDDRALVNQLIREGLKREGSLNQMDLSLTILTPVSLTQAQCTQTHSYQPGHVLRFGQQESSQIKGETYWTIIEINPKTNLIQLKDASDKVVFWQVPSLDKTRQVMVEVFQSESRNLQSGDLIRWSRTNKEQGLLSSESAQIIALTTNKMRVQLANKKIVELDTKDPKNQHWDSGYAGTVYAVQGKTKSIVLAHLESFRPNLTTQPAFLVALTRAVNEFKLYTDNKDQLLKMIEKNLGTKTSGLEIIGQYPNVQKSDYTQKITDQAIQSFVKNQQNSHPFNHVAASISALTIARTAEQIGQKNISKEQQYNFEQKIKSKLMESVPDTVSSTPSLTNLNKTKEMDREIG